MEWRGDRCYKDPLITIMRACFVPILAVLLPLGCGGKVIVDGLGVEGGGGGGGSSGGSGVVSFAVAPESLTVDKVQPGDSGLSPNGQPDGVFDAKVVGSIQALLVVSTDAGG